MAVATDERLGVRPGGAFLEAADEHHVPVELAELGLPFTGERLRHGAPLTCLTCHCMAFPGLVGRTGK